MEGGGGAGLYTPFLAPGVSTMLTEPDTSPHLLMAYISPEQ